MPLEELAFDHKVFNDRYLADDKLYARFYQEVMPAGVVNGIKKFENVEMISIMQPGNKLSMVVRVARPEDKERFAKSYAMFVNGKEEQFDGTPLKEWSAVDSPALLEELKYMGFRTVESVSKASDAACTNYPGMRMLKMRAERWLTLQAEKAPAVALEAALADRDKMLASMQEQMDAMKAALEAAGLKAA